MAPYGSGNKLESQGGLAIDYGALLNEAQLKAAVHEDGPHLVIAGAGTGKTRTLVYRLAHLVEQGTDPRSVLLLTFTRKAAQEMMHRASRILDERCDQVFGGTFHSFGNMILRKYARQLGYSPNFTILDRTDASEVLGLLRTELELSRLKTRFPRKEALASILSRSVNTGRPISRILADEYGQFQAEEKNILRMADEYGRYKLERSMMDYDDLLVNLRRLLEEHEPVRVRLSNTYRYIMVDEYQDTNRLQAEIVRLLASEHQNIMVVGDDSQSIYSFRGADFRNIMDFPKLFPGCVITTLEQNYRSTQPILSLTNAIIASARVKYSKNLFSEISGDGKPVYFRPRNEYYEARFVCSEILDLVKNGARLGDMAVLFRSGSHSNDLEVELASQSIPFVKHGGIKFAEAAHVKDVLAILRVALNPMDSIAWQRALLLIKGVGGATARGIIKKAVEEGLGYDALVAEELAKKKYANELRRLFELISEIRTGGTGLAGTVKRILEFYTPTLQEKYDDHKERMNDLVSLVHISERYGRPEKLLSDLTIESPERSLVQAASDDPRDRMLVLSTIHSAKGLEWETVFLIHVVDGCLPSSYAIFREEGIEEERRLFYVATTRAKRNLYLIAPMMRSGGPLGSYGLPSRFLLEIKNLHRLTTKVA